MGFSTSLLLIFSLAFTVTYCEVTVDLENGKILGEKRGNYFAFEGIPYAEPPVGALRFEPPKPYAQKWTTPRNCTKIGELKWDRI